MGGEALLDWYETVRRPLPWRFTRDPWAILVAEVMLQQTQAARVVPHYERFLARFPRRGRCAAAPAAEAIARLERARLQPPRAGAAGGGAGRRGGARLAAPERLEELPGVGPYTAAAVGSFAWDAQVAAVDTNVRRVIERRDGVRRSPRALARARGRAAARGPGGGVEPGDDGARRDGLPAAAAALRRVPAPGGLRRAATRSRPRPRPRGERFEASDRWARGRLLAALVAGEQPPDWPRSGASGRSPGSRATGWWSARGRRAAAAVRRRRSTRAALAEARHEARRADAARGRGRGRARRADAAAPAGRLRARARRRARRGRVLRRRTARRARSSTRSRATRCSAATRRRWPTRARSAGAAPGGRGRSRGGCASARPTTRRPRTALLEIVIEPAPGAFGTGAHPTTRMTPRAAARARARRRARGPRLRLGCGRDRRRAAGLGARLRARLRRSARSTRRRATRSATASPSARCTPTCARSRRRPPTTLAANLPLYVHERVARALSPATRARDRAAASSTTQQAAATRGLRRGRAGARAAARVADGLGGAVAGAA